MKALKLLEEMFGRTKVKKIDTDMKCCVSKCKKRAKFMGGDGILSVFFWCEDHVYMNKEIITGKIILHAIPNHTLLKETAKLNKGRKNNGKLQRRSHKT